MTVNSTQIVLAPRSDELFQLSRPDAVELGPAALEARLRAFVSALARRRLLPEAWREDRDSFGRLRGWVFRCRRVGEDETVVVR